MSAQGGDWGIVCLRGDVFQGGCLPGGGVSAWGVCQTTPVNRMTDAFENIRVFLS